MLAGDCWMDVLYICDKAKLLEREGEATFDGMKVPLNDDWLADGLMLALLLMFIQRLSSTSAFRINLIHIEIKEFGRWKIRYS